VSAKSQILSEVPIVPLRFPVRGLFVFLAAMALAGCAAFERAPERPAYVDAEVRPPLEVPPDLLGIPIDDARTIPLAGGSAGPLPGVGGVGGAVRTRDGDGQPVINVFGDIGRAWTRTGSALRRMDLTVRAEDPQQASFVVVYRPYGSGDLFEEVEPEAHRTPQVEDSWLQRIVRRVGLFSEVRGDPREFIVSLRAAQVGTDIYVLDARGRPDNSPGAEQIRENLYDALR
jgi:uncharacterized lipoprotein